MATIEGLPEIVLRAIFEFVYDDHTPFSKSSHYDRLVHFRPVMAVCRMWRHLSLDIFYRTIVCEIRRDSRAKTTSASTNGQDSNGQRTQPNQFCYTYIKTNIKLAITGEYVNLARKIYLGIHNSGLIWTSQVSFSETLDMLRKANFDSVQWPNILQFYYYETKSISKMVRGERGNAEPLFRYLLNSLPNIDNIACHNLAYATGDTTLLEYISNTLLSTAKRIHIHSRSWQEPISQSIRFTSRELTHLHLDYISVNLNSPSLLPAKVYAPSLQYLHFIINTFEFDWSSFYDDRSTEPCIEFSSLKILSIKVFTLNDHTISILGSRFGRSIKKCQFPALESLSLVNYIHKENSFVSLFTSTCNSLKRLYLNRLYEYDGAIHDLDDSIFTNLESFALRTSQKISDKQLKKLIYKLQVNMASAKHISINLTNLDSPVLSLIPNPNCWQNLQYLSIHSPIEIDKIPAFIRELGCLRVFEMQIYPKPQNIVEGHKDISTNVSQTPHQDHPQKVFSSNLRELRLLPYTCYNIDPASISIFGEMIVSYPFLQKIALPKCSYLKFVEYIKEAVSEYKLSSALYTARVYLPIVSLKNGVLDMDEGNIGFLLRDLIC